MDSLRRAFRDISAGYTRGTILGRPAVIKHLSHSDQIDLDDKREEFYEFARSNGAKTDEERLKEAIKSGQWSGEKERELARAKTYIEELYEGKKKNVNNPSMVKAYMDKIEQAKKEYEQKQMDKRMVLGRTCEVYAEEEINDYYILYNLFKDIDLRIPLFRVEDLDYVPEKDMSQISNDYRKAMEPCSDKGVKKLAMQGFFQRYFQICQDDFTSFFGVPICRLTFNQVDLIRWGSHFKGLYSKHDVSKWPKNVLDDPDLMIEYASSVDEKRRELEEKGANDADTMVIGMKDEDAKVTGVKSHNPIQKIANMGMDFFGKK